VDSPKTDSLVEKKSNVKGIEMNRVFPQNLISRSKSVVWVRLAVCLAVVLFAAVPIFAQISDSAKAQIAEIYSFKKSFTPAEQKMSSSLVLASRMARGIDLGNLAQFVDSSLFDVDGKLEVVVHASLTSSVVSDITAKGGELGAHSYQFHSASARMNAEQLLALASNPDVQAIREKEKARTNVGSVTSQGVVSHAANKANASGYRGQGVNIGVLSDSALPARVAALIASGDLPADVTILPGEQGPSNGEDEGAAMMEIVHDLAPDAKLFFATAFTSAASFASNIETLRSVYHCDIIVDDVTYFNEGVFQDGPIADAVNDVVADGAMYFSSAANSGNKDSNTSGTWEGDFTNAGPVSGPILGFGETGNLHDFDPSAAVQTFDRLTVSSTFLSLKWSDPLAASSDDYDFFVLNAAGTAVIAFSAGFQNGTQDPYEHVSSGAGFPVNSRLVVVQFSGADRFLHVDTERGQLSLNTAGATFGHNAAANTITLAATYWNSAHTGTKPFAGFANPIEVFSSDGTSRVFLKPEGTPLTPCDFSSTGGIVLQKPDLTAADGVSTRTPGFTPFFGTSAAAPHAAAIAALVKSANPSLTGAQIKQILINTALDNMAPGADRDGGFGIVMADKATYAATHP
jgi:subtilisin family serine protease